MAKVEGEREGSVERTAATNRASLSIRRSDRTAQKSFLVEGSNKPRLARQNKNVVRNPKNVHLKRKRLKRNKKDQNWWGTGPSESSRRGSGGRSPCGRESPRLHPSCR
eukprot:6329488-Prymnesium_polylepis.1